MLDTTKIKEEIDTTEFLKTIKRYCKENIECTEHTFFRLSKRQKEILTCDRLREILIREKPFLVGIQNNENYAVFYNHEGKILKTILSILNSKIRVVTFYFIKKWQIPKI